MRVLLEVVAVVSGGDCCGSGGGGDDSGRGTVGIVSLGVKILYKTRFVYHFFIVDSGVDSVINSGVQGGFGGGFVAA